MFMYVQNKVKKNKVDLFDIQSFCVVCQQIHTRSHSLMYERSIKEIIKIISKKGLKVERDFILNCLIPSRLQLTIVLIIESAPQRIISNILLCPKPKIFSLLSQRKRKAATSDDRQTKTTKAGLKSVHGFKRVLIRISPS